VVHKYTLNKKGKRSEQNSTNTVIFFSYVRQLTAPFGGDSPYTLAAKNPPILYPAFGRWSESQPKYNPL